jgi:hypothetical protein
MPLQIRRGTQADREDLVTSYVPLTVGEPLFTTDEGNLYVGDGITPGGVHVNAPQIFDFGTYEGQIGEIEKQPITQPGVKSPFITLDGVAVTIDLDGQISSNVRPNFNELFDLGSDNFRFRKLWISGNGIQVGEALLFNDGTTLTLPFGSTINGQAIATGQGINPGDLYVISIGSDDSTVVLDHTTGTLTGTLKGNVVTLSDDVVIDTETKTATFEEINITGGSLINGNPVFITGGATFLSTDPGIITAPTVTAAAIHNETIGSSFNISRGRGTFLSPAIVQNGDNIGSIEFSGYDGEIFNASVQLLAKVNGTPSFGQFIPSELIVSVANGVTKIPVTTFKPTQVEFEVAPVMPSLTSTERNALTPAVGMMIYNTTDNKFQGYQNTGGTTLEWVNLS